MDTGFYHEPVLLKEVINSLCVNKNGIYVDGTVGGAGHAQAILQETNGFLIGIERDDEALNIAEQKLAQFGSRKVLVKGNFADLSDILKKLNIEKVDAVLLDLGVSSHQLDAAERGFSFSKSAPLDMRMDRCQRLTAYEIVNSFSQRELERIIRDYGEERMAVRIARTITQKRKTSPVETTVELAAIVAGAMLPSLRRQQIHPATRTFQAIRIAVNNELDNLKKAIESGIAVLNAGGRMGIISFHSLEDRLVKNEFRYSAQSCVCPPDMPVCVCNKEVQLRVLTRKAIMPQQEEINLNPRARSARLRVAERV